MEDLKDYHGRLFVQSRLSPDVQRQAETLPTMREEKDGLFCNRCASPIDKRKSALPIGGFYCRTCLLLGRVRSDQALYYFPQQAFDMPVSLLWEGQLTPFQAAISKDLCLAVEKGRDSLVHAVTGAGKTEMIYQVLIKHLTKGHSVCIASPRIDVCIELHKRLAKDFSCPIALLHGQGEAYFRTPLVIATTHQLLTFYQAFDLLIVDEVDAFPFVDNAMLYQAVKNCLKPRGRKIFLTATTTDELDRQVQRKELDLLRLPRRFHENPLVLPQKIWLSDLIKKVKRGKLPRRLKHYIKKQRETGYPLLIFMPEIAMGQVFSTVLQAVFPEEKVAFVSSQTENRLQLVTAFRDREISILVSTTILERGVTFPFVDVFVLESNHRLYTKSSLIQIGGRVGRSLERPTGLLYFFQDGTNKAIETAIAEIKLMNKESGLCHRV